MNVSVMMQVPIDVAVDLKERLRVLTLAHEKDVAAHEKKIKLSHGDPGKLAVEGERLSQRGRRLTINNLLRVALMHGAANVVGMKDADLFGHIAETGVARGRPREVMARGA